MQIILKLKSVVLTLTCLVVSFHTSAQDTSAIEQIILNADRTEVSTQAKPPTTSYLGNVKAYHKGAFIFCDNAILKGNSLYAAGNVSIIQHDTVQVYSDTLIYQGDSSLAYLIGGVILINGNDTLYTEELVHNLSTKIARYNKRAQMKTGGTKLKSQLGEYNTSLKEAWFYQKVSIESDSLYVTTDTLRYLTEEGQSNWKSPGIVKTKDAKLYSESGNYNSKSEVGIFIGNAEYLADTVTATADTMYYDGKIDLMSLKGKALYFTPSDSAKGDAIYYNKSTDSISISGNADYIGKANKAKADTIIFNKKSDQFDVKGKSELVDGSVFIKGDNVKYDKKSKFGKAVGNVYYQDTLEKMEVWADTLDYNGSVNYMRATSKGSKKPVYSSVMDDDTLFLSAKVLISSEKYITKKDSTRVLILITDSLSANQLFNTLQDTITYLTADKDVLLYSKNMQALADSMQFDGKDSVFTFFKNPILWTDSTQMTGDTIAITLENEKVSQLKLLKNSLVVTSPDQKYFNQIKGKSIVSKFDDEGDMKTMRVDGNAQLLYYLMDDEDDSYIGVNTTDCSAMLFLFDSSKIQQINFYNKPNSKISPMKGTDHDKIKLEGFILRFDERPLSKTDVFSYVPKQPTLPIQSAGPKGPTQSAPPTQSSRPSNPIPPSNRTSNRRTGQ
jgi:lipopolysaccharide export system protein LptA